MGNYLNMGNDGFQSIRKGLYVDKTGLLIYMNAILGTAKKLTCVSRPRRFGKSFAAKMLCAYYDKSCDSRELFEDLEISKAPSFERNLNKYDVIYLDITWFISTRRGSITNIVADMQNRVIQELVGIYPSIAGQDESSLPEVLSQISRTTGNKFIIIIDEWDAFFRETKDDSALQKDYIQLLRGLFKSPITDKTIEAAYMTGILPIKKYGTQSALTDFIEYTMISPKNLAEYVGFTEAEVKQLCKRYGMEFLEAKKWYDGYAFSSVRSVYNPSAIAMAMQTGEYASYWTSTETYESLKFYIDMDFDGLKDAIVWMLSGERCPVDTISFQNDMTNIRSRDDVFTLLIHLGYLAYDAGTKSVTIPNEEIRQEFVTAVKNGRYTELAALIKESDLLLQYTLNQDEDAVAEAIEKAHSASTAPVFYNNEQALRSVIRMAYISCVDKFQEIQELPSGIGYADVVYLPKKNSPMPIILIELKWNKTADGAVKQIGEKNYPQIFDGYGSDILLVGISYDEKTKKHNCVIEKCRR